MKQKNKYDKNKKTKKESARDFAEKILFLKPKERSRRRR